jgi:hypothetical protein
MDNSSQQDNLQTQLNHFIAENESLKAQLEEYLYIINTRDRDIESLQRKVNDIVQEKSNTVNQLEELEILQDNIGLLKQQIKNTSGIEIDIEKEVSHAVSNWQQLEDMKNRYAYLRTQLNDLQEQVQELNNRNLLLQQQASCIAELESLLEISERENDELKNQIAQQEKG